MKPELKGFFESMEAFFSEPGPAGLERLRAAHPGWTAPDSRVALYGGMVRHHVVKGVEKLYPLVRQGVTEEAWEELLHRYMATKPARHFELNRLGEAFPGFVADVASELKLAPWLPALARFEWTDFAVYSSEEQVPERVERLTPNPTLAVLQHPWKLCPLVRGGGQGEPEAGEEIALLWRHPKRLVTMYMAADDAALLALKMAVEGLTPAQVAEATGVAEATIQAGLERCAADGLVLLP
jgi:hypothetical protein